MGKNKLYKPKVSVRAAAIDAHSAFIHHDTACKICSYTSRMGPSWRRGMCSEGLRLLGISEVASKKELAK